jgi:hypothetical protein
LIDLIVAVTALGLVICYNQPRAGIFLTLATGFLADPVRKLVPGQPVILVAIVVVFAGVTFLGALKRGQIPPLRKLAARAGRMRRPVALFLALVALQSLAAAARTGSLMIAGIGLLAYLAPVPAVLLGFGMARSEGALVRIVLFYTFVAGVFASGIFLSAAGWDSPILSSVGEDLVAYSADTGQALVLLCGFFRASEIAGWHCATAACLLIVLAAAYRRRSRFVALAGAATVYFLAAIVFTGRRKAFVVVLLFVLVFGFLLVRFRRGAKTLAGVFLVAIAGAYLFGETMLFSENFASRYQLYFERERTTTTHDAIDRMKDMTVDSVGYIIRQNGLFGRGAGTGSQGSQHFGGGAELVGGSAEGGLGKILAELGVPGVLLLAWIGVLLVRRMTGKLHRIGRRESTRAILALGMLAMLATNAIEFLTAHQAFGDPFVLLMLGWMLGFLLGILNPSQPPEPIRRTALQPPRVAVVAPAEPIRGIVGFDV